MHSITIHTQQTVELKLSKRICHFYVRCNGKTNYTCELLTTVNVGVKKQNELITFSGIEESEMHLMWSPIYCLKNKKRTHMSRYKVVLVVIESNVGSYYRVETF